MQLDVRILYLLTCSGGGCSALAQNFGGVDADGQINLVIAACVASRRVALGLASKILVQRAYHISTPANKNSAVIHSSFCGNLRCINIL